MSGDRWRKTGFGVGGLIALAALFLGVVMLANFGLPALRLDLTQTTLEAHQRLKAKLRQLCDKLELHPHLFERSLYLGQNIPIGGTAHQAGTLVFGTDPRTSVLDTNCKAHGIDNLYVTDASFFPSIGAVNPTLTIIANALRVGEHLAARLR